ncbi:hypothetical protein ON010_g5631 [Phytophthora cinnamomi]|nr:hypothetical protein ON010_g5631 [Phytophthora cinnamomi]
MVGVDLEIDESKLWDPAKRQAYMDALPDMTLFEDHVVEGDEMVAAIQALIEDGETAESLALHWKNQGNDMFSDAKKAHRGYFANAMKYYNDALAYAYKALALPEDERDLSYDMHELTSQILCNRAAVQLELRNYGSCRSDAAKAINFDPSNVKAYYRGAKASRMLRKPADTLRYCEEGLKRDPENKLLLKLQVEQNRKRSLRRLRGRQFPAYWGRGTYALYDARVLVQKIQNMLLSNIHGDWFRKPQVEGLSGDGGGEEEGEKAPLVHYLALPSDRQDPNLFAYWVAGNLPLDWSQRLELLSLNSTVRILRREIELLEQVEEDIFCSMCGSLIANTREIFSMTARGAAGGTFVNPGGHVFQVLTLREVDRAHVFVHMDRSTQDTWFAGYAWSITHCNSCYQHLGWRFDRVDSTRSPGTFYGFRRAALTRSRESRRLDPRSLSLDGYDTDNYGESVASSEGSPSSDGEAMPLLHNAE